MFTFSENKSLKEYNTFGIAVNARYFLSIESSGDLISFFSENPQFQKEELLILGGGSNLLFLEDFKGLILYPQIKGVKIIAQSEENLQIQAGAGEKWDDFVSNCVENGWGGLENLSLIPGNVGAVPVQNIGAYGVEAASSIVEVNALDLRDFTHRSFTNSECNFGYRNSIFKNEWKNHFLITSVVFLLNKKPSLNFTYGALKAEMSKWDEVNIKNLRKAVISIRESKLPDPGKIGNAGSFFKNPVINSELSQKLKKQYSEIPLFPCPDGLFKTSAGWMIENAGWKGKSYRNAAVYEKQGLVLINKGNATGEEIFELAELIKKDINSKFGIPLEPEVNIIARRH